MAKIRHISTRLIFCSYLSFTALNNKSDKIIFQSYSNILIYFVSVLT